MLVRLLLLLLLLLLPLLRAGAYLFLVACLNRATKSNYCCINTRTNLPARVTCVTYEYNYSSCSTAPAAVYARVPPKQNGA